MSCGTWAPWQLMAIVALPLFVLDHRSGRPYPKCVSNENLRQNLYQSMEMTFWLPQTETALAQVDA